MRKNLLTGAVKTLLLLLLLLVLHLYRHSSKSIYGSTHQANHDNVRTDIKDRICKA